MKKYPKSWSESTPGPKSAVLITYLGPRPVFIGFFNIFMLPSSVFHKNTPFGTLKMYENLVGKWLWAQIYQFQTTYLGPRPILDRCFIVFIALLSVFPKNKTTETNKLSEKCLESTAGPKFITSQIINSGPEPLSDQVFINF